MDLDVLEKNGRTLLAFKAELETLLPEVRKAISDALALAGDVEEVKSLLSPAIEKIEAMKPALDAVADDIAQIKETLGPALEWIAEQQKAIEAAKAAEQQKVDDAAKAHQLHETSETAKAAAEAEAKPAEPEVKPSAVQGEAAPAERSESEQSSA